MRESTAEVPHQIAAAHLPEAASVCDAATAPDTTLAMLDPQPTLVELLGRHVLLPHALLLQSEINSKQANDDIGYLRRFREADGLTDQALHARPECQMFPLDFLCMTLAWAMHLRGRRLV